MKDLDNNYEILKNKYIEIISDEGSENKSLAPNNIDSSLLALKIQNVKDCIKFSRLFTEVGFNLIMPNRLPLIKLQ